jgi:hypothetical protein
MKPYGTYKIRNQRGAEAGFRAGVIAPSIADPIELAIRRIARAERRTHRVVASISDELRSGDERSSLRIRRVFAAPREVFRVELERPDLSYQRTTLLGREALEELLETDGIQTAVEVEG